MQQQESRPTHRSTRKRKRRKLAVLHISVEGAGATATFCKN